MWPNASTAGVSRCAATTSTDTASRTGKPGALPSDSYLLDNLADIVESTRLRMDASMPLILLGHSLGGLVAARLVSLNRIKVDGLVLSSPALDAGMNRFQKFLVSVLPRIAPNLRVGNGLDPSFLSHESTVVQAYLDDPKVHDRISARLARFIADAGPATLACASQWSVPTLLIYAGADKLVDPAGSRAFAKAAPRNVVASQCFDSMYHEIFNEVEREKVFSRLHAWLDANFQGSKDRAYCRARQRLLLLQQPPEHAEQVARAPKAAFGSIAVRREFVDQAWQNLRKLGRGVVLAHA